VPINQMAMWNVTLLTRQTVHTLTQCRK